MQDNGKPRKIPKTQQKVQALSSNICDLFIKKISNAFNEIWQSFFFTIVFYKPNFKRI